MKKNEVIMRRIRKKEEKINTIEKEPSSKKCQKK